MINLEARLKYNTEINFESWFKIDFCFVFKPRLNIYHIPKPRHENNIYLNEVHILKILDLGLDVFYV